MRYNEAKAIAEQIKARQDKTGKTISVIKRIEMSVKSCNDCPFPQVFRDMSSSVWVCGMLSLENGKLPNGFRKSMPEHGVIYDDGILPNCPLPDA